MRTSRGAPASGSHGAAILAFVALPGMVAFALPLAFAAWTGLAAALGWPGIVPVVIGGAVLVACSVEFHRRGRGTLAPWSPPQRLVTSGWYAHSRNPMYLAVLLVLLGWSWVFRSGVHAIYALAVALAFHLRVVLAEEPRQARAFAGEWPAYRASVPRWLPPLRRWPWTLWLGAGLLLGASLWMLSPALLGRNEPWDADLPLWSFSWPLVGALAATARHWRGLWLPVGDALAQMAVTLPATLTGKFGVLGWTFIGGGLAVALAVALALLGTLALWQRLRPRKEASP